MEIIHFLQKKYQVTTLPDILKNYFTFQLFKQMKGMIQ